MQLPGPLVRRHLAEADAAYTQLAQAIEAKDWSHVHESSRQLYRAFSAMRDSGAAAPTLVAMRDSQEIDDIRRLVAELADRADDVRDSMGPGRGNSDVVTPHEFARLKRSYDELRTKVTGWPSVDE